MRISSKLSIALALIGLCISASTQPVSHNVFQIGVFDRSAAEFGHGRMKLPVTFVVGKSDPASDWFPSQPASSGASDPNAEDASSPRAIQFTLAADPMPSYRFHAALILNDRAVPALQIAINGRRGVFYLDSTLHSTLGGMDDGFDTAYVPADVVLNFPGTYLRKGTNTITLQVIRTGQPDSLPTGLTYDALELGTNTEPLPPPAVSAKVLPTIFYKQSGATLSEIIDVFMNHDSPAQSAEADISVGDTHYRQSSNTSQDFGEEKFEFSIPAFSPGTRAHLALQVDGSRSDIEQVIDPQTKWTLFLVPHIHLDVGYSDYQAKVAAIQSRAVDEALDFSAHNPGFKYSVDGSWVLDQFLNTRSAADQRRAIAAMKNGQLFVPAEYANLLTGFPTAETLIRSLYRSANIAREHGTPFNYADITDVPSYSWSYASILASAGIKYFIAGPNGHETRAPVLLQGRLNEKSPFWWQGPDGNKVLFWYSRHYWQMGILCGVPPVIAAGHETIPLLLKAYERPSYRADAVIIYGSQQENSDLYPQQAVFAREWNQTYAYPRMQYSGFYDALKAIAAPFGNDIPTVTGDGGPYWEDGIAADAGLAAKERQIESRAAAVEQLATLSSLVNPRLAPDKQALDRMWTDMVLADEHTFTSHDVWTDPTSDETLVQSAVKENFAEDATLLGDSLAKNSMDSLVDSISAGHHSLVVFNSLNWKRSGPVLFDLNHGEEIVDPSTDRAVPVETIAEGNALRHVRFVASDIPANGYKVFALRRGSGLAAADSSRSTVLESQYYRVTLDPESGAVRSILDKEQGRELVDQQSPYRFGQYLYVSGGDQRPNSLLQYRLIPLPPPLQVSGAHSGHLISTIHTPDGWVAHMESSDTNTPAISTEIRLPEHAKRIEFVEELDKQEVKSREAVYFAFPFAMNHPQFQYEIQTGVVDPTKDMYPGAGHNWFSVQHWVSVQQGGLSATVMPLDAGLVTLGDIYRGIWPDHFGDRKGTIFSFAMNNYWSTNYKSGQGGKFRFRYVVTSAPSTQSSQLSRMGWEESTKLEHDEVTTQDKWTNEQRAWPGTQASFLDIQDTDLLLETWKAAEDGRGTILRFLDLGGSARKVTVHSPLFQLTRAVQTDAVERDQKALPLAGVHGFTFTIRPHEIVTVRLVATRAASRTISSAPAKVASSSQ